MRKFLMLMVALATVPGMALAWRAWNRLEVQDLGHGVYEVIGRVGSGPQDYWCGAGDYAIAVLQVPVAQRIFIWRALGPSVSRPGKKAVQFALSPPEGADTSTGFSLTVRRAGDNLNAATARQYCFEGRVDDFRWRP